MDSCENLDVYVYVVGGFPKVDKPTPLFLSPGSFCCNPEQAFIML